MHKGSRALVLAGGGVAGIAWELGMVAGLIEAGVDLLGADVIIGSSAGAAAGAQIATGCLDEAVAMQRRDETSEIMVELDGVAWRRQRDAMVADAADADEARRRLGQFGLQSQTVPEPVRRAVIAARLPVHEWPARDLRITAIDAQTGELVVFTKDSGVPLVDAVAASCAVPGVWPAVTIGDRRYVDGGSLSGTNVHLAAGYERVVLLMPGIPLDAQVERLAGEVAQLAGARYVQVTADEASIAAIGLNALDPSTRRPAEAAGRQQASAEAARVQAVWTGTA